MTNIAITILGLLVFFSIVGYISFLVVTAIVDAVRIKGHIYKQTKAYKRLIERNNAETYIELLRNIIRMRDELGKTDDAVLDWDLFDWLRYFKGYTKD